MFPVGQALTVTMSICQGAVIPGDFHSFVMVPALPLQQTYQLPQGEDGQSHAGPKSKNYIQQEVLDERHIVHGRAQVAGTVVTEHVVDPVDGPGHRVAWLVFVNFGKQLCLTAVPM